LDRSLSRGVAWLAALVVSGGLFYLSSSPVLAGLGLLIYVGLAWLRLDLALASVIVFVPYFMHPKHVVLGRHAEFAPSELLLVAVALIAGVIILLDLLRVGPPARRGRLPAGSGKDRRSDFPWPAVWPEWNILRGSPFLLPTLLFTAAALISTAFAVEQTVALRELRETIIEPVIYFALLLLFIGGLPPEPRRRALLILGIAVVVAGTLVSLLGLAQYVSGSKDLVTIPGSSYRRIRAWYGSPDNLGLLLDRSIPLCLALLLAPVLLVRRLSRQNDLQSSNRALGSPWAVGLALCLLFMMAALALTFSLGAWIAIGLTVAIFVVMLGFVARDRLRRQRGIVAVAGVAVTGLLALALYAGFSGHLAGAFAHVHGVTAQRRIDVWRSSVRMIRDHPLVGVGPDNFLHYYAPKHQRFIRCAHGLGYMQPAAHDEPCLSQPHDELLDFWLSTGILGLLAFAALQMVFWRIIYQQRNHLPQAPVMLGAALAMLAALIHGLIDESYFLPDLSMLTWLLFAIAALSAPNGRRLNHPLGPPGG